MRISNFQALFITNTLMGTFISISSSSWFSAWVGLELNLMSFTPLISTKDSQFSSEAAMKYFLIQALGSTVIIMGACLMLFSATLSAYMLTIALLLKMGAAPFHFWLPQIMEGLLWTDTILLLTIQKIAPMLLLSYITNNEPVILLSLILSSLVGAVGGLNQTLLRKIMAFSSINHMSWMLSALLLSEPLWFYYFIVYSVSSASVILLFYFFNFFHLSSITELKTFNPLHALLFSFSLLSLGGLPPFIGFFPKWLIIQQLVSSNLHFILVFLLSSSLLTLYFYLRIIFPFLTNSSIKTFWPSIPSLINKPPIMLIYLNITGLTVLPFLYLF